MGCCISGNVNMNKIIEIQQLHQQELQTNETDDTIQEESIQQLNTSTLIFLKDQYQHHQQKLLQSTFRRIFVNLNLRNNATLELAAYLYLFHIYYYYILNENPQPQNNNIEQIANQRRTIIQSISIFQNNFNFVMDDWINFIQNDAINLLANQYIRNLNAQQLPFGIPQHFFRNSLLREIFPRLQMKLNESQQFIQQKLGSRILKCNSMENINDILI